MGFVGHDHETEVGECEEVIDQRIVCGRCDREGNETHRRFVRAVFGRLVQGRPDGVATVSERRAPIGRRDRKVFVGHHDLASDFDVERLGERDWEIGDQVAVVDDRGAKFSIAASDHVVEGSADVSDGERHAIEFGGHDQSGVRTYPVDELRELVVGGDLAE